MVTADLSSLELTEHIAIVVRRIRRSLWQLPCGYLEAARPLRARRPASGADVAYWPCALKAQINSGGRFHPESCRLIWKLTSGTVEGQIDEHLLMSICSLTA